MNKWFREPLLHFFVLGAFLFGLFAWVNGDDTKRPDEIVIDDARIEGLQTNFRRVWQRDPTSEELKGILDAWIREEILYREGLAIGLDRDDPVVRRRISQKMAFISDWLAADTPSDAELQAWLDTHTEQYTIKSKNTFRQVYFDPARHGDRLDETLVEARAALARESTEPFGDPTLLPASLSSVSLTETARVFGNEFAEAIANIPLGVWHGPVSSGYGVHLVLLTQHEPGRVPRLDEVRTAVERDLIAARNKGANDAFYRALRERYSITFATGVTMDDDTNLALSQP